MTIATIWNHTPSLSWGLPAPHRPPSTSALLPMRGEDVLRACHVLLKYASFHKEDSMGRASLAKELASESWHRPRSASTMGDREETSEHEVILAGPAHPVQVVGPGGIQTTHESEGVVGTPHRVSLLVDSVALYMPH